MAVEFKYQQAFSRITGYTFNYLNHYANMNVAELHVVKLPVQLHVVHCSPNADTVHR